MAATEPVPLGQQHEARLAQIDKSDGPARYQLGLWLLEQYDSSKLNVEALDLAEAELKAAQTLGVSDRGIETLLSTIKRSRADAQKKRYPDYFKMAFSVIGGLGIFLLGMKHMSEGVQAVAGQGLRRMINAVTDNRLMAVGVGTGVTCLIQSSSITTVIVVGLVNSGMMALHQAIGVIMGANIGTTITGWILVLKIGKYGLPILGLAAFVWLFSRKERWRYVAMAVMGLGMIFFGLELMKNGFKPMKDVPAFQDAFQWFVPDGWFGVLKCALVGCMLTFIVQSSSATLGITIGLASTGAIQFETAAALVLGENIGTTITAWLASIGATVNAKRAAYAHVLFNLLGVAWITLLFGVYIKLIDWWVLMDLGHRPIGLDPGTENYGQIVTFAIASVHTGFNVANVVLFLPFVRYFARLLERLVPDSAVKQAPHLTALDVRFVDSPVIGIEQSHGEILKMADGIEKMLDWTAEVAAQDEPDEAIVRKAFHREQIMDNVQQEVIHFLTDLLSGQVPHSVTQEGRQQLRIADEYESVSDYISSVLKSYLRLAKAGVKLSPDEQETIDQLHRDVAAYVRMITEAYAHRQADVMSRATTQGDAITHRVKDLRDAHVVALTESKIDPVHSMCYMALLNNYRKIKDHAVNIAEAISGS